jgi:PTS system nitrogen regulatory IIA component
MQGEFRLNRVDLLEWATDRRIKVSPRLFAEEDGPGATMPSLYSALLAGGVHYGVTGDDPFSVLTNVVSLLPLPPFMDPEFLLQTLMAREALGTTAMGDGIAIPHVRNPILLTAVAPTVLLCFLDRPVDFKAVDERPVDTLFTLLTPTVNIHLHLLSRLAYLIRDDAFKDLLRRRAPAAEILTAVEEMERGLEGKKRM